MLECFQHTYLIILGTENSSWMVHEKCRSSPSEGLCPLLQRLRRHAKLPRGGSAPTASPLPLQTAARLGEGEGLGDELGG